MQFKTKNAVVIAAGSVLAVSFFANVNADYVLKYKRHTDQYTVSGKTVPASDATPVTTLAKDRCRIDQNADTAIIVRLDKNVVYYVNNKKKQYSEISLDAINKVFDTASTAKDQPASQQEMPAMMAGMMKMMKMEATVTPGAQQKKIGAWNCTQYTVAQTIMMSTSNSEIWATSDIKIDPEFYAKFLSAPMFKMQGSEKIIAEMKKIKGVPVQINSTATVMNSEIKSSEELLDVSETNAAADLFEIPKGYKKVK
jgi:hypothetical protein